MSVTKYKPGYGRLRINLIEVKPACQNDKTSSPFYSIPGAVKRMASNPARNEAIQRLPRRFRYTDDDEVQFRIPEFGEPLHTKARWTLPTTAKLDLEDLISMDYNNFVQGSNLDVEEKYLREITANLTEKLAEINCKRRYPVRTEVTPALPGCVMHVDDDELEFRIPEFGEPLHTKASWTLPTVADLELHDSHQDSSFIEGSELDVEEDLLHEVDANSYGSLSSFTGRNGFVVESDHINQRPTFATEVDDGEEEFRIPEFGEPLHANASWNLPAVDLELEDLSATNCCNFIPENQVEIVEKYLSEIKTNLTENLSDISCELRKPGLAHTTPKLSACFKYAADDEAEFRIPEYGEPLHTKATWALPMTYEIDLEDFIVKDHRSQLEVGEKYLREMKRQFMESLSEISDQSRHSIMADVSPSLSEFFQHQNKVELEFRRPEFSGPLDTNARGAFPTVADLCIQDLNKINNSGVIMDNRANCVKLSANLKNVCKRLRRRIASIFSKGRQ